jgi:cytochrome c biogenesis protein CcmG/thiol:disulfide interchange protein DsbE
VAALLLTRSSLGRRFVVKIAFDAGRVTPSCQALRRITAAVLLSALPAAGLAVEPVSGLNLKNRNGSSFSLESLKGQVVVVDFWASWCIPCRTSFPFLDALQARYESKGLRVVGLTLEDNEDAINAFLDSVLVRFTIVRDPTGHAGEVFDVTAMPTTFLLDREGRVAARFEGGDKGTHARLESAVATLLSGGTLAPGADVRVSKSLEATSGLKAWQRGYLADPIMSLDGDVLTRMLREHIHASKEGSAGDGGPSGGGCGCN